MSAFDEFKIRTVEDLVLLIQIVIWSFVVIVLMTVFGGTVMSMVYSLMYVQQPIKTMAPIDAAFTKMLNDVMLLMTGSVTTLIGMFAIKAGAKAIAEKIAPSVITPLTTPTTPIPVSAPQSVTSNDLPVWVNPPLDEEWRAPPPPTTPPDYIDPEKEKIANERALARADQ
jgi:hypothetical protein